MINIIQKNEIISLYRNNIPKKEIARRLGISKNTVKSYINEYEKSTTMLSQETDKAKIAIIQEQLCSKPSRKSYVKKKTIFNNDIEKRFLELIHIDEERDKELGPNKQHLTASLLHRTLISEGFIIGETTIRNEFRKYKQKNKECFIKQFYEYGERAEYDFHQIKVIIAGNLTIMHQATISLPKSNIVFGKLYTNEKMDAFIDSLVSFFEFCNGVTKTVVFDNMRNAVKKFIYRNEKEYTDELIKISNYYGFIIKTTNPRKGNEKGHVENSGKTTRRDFFSLHYKFESLEDLILYYDNECNKRNQEFIDEFNNEKKYLLKLPIRKYEIGRLVKCHVNSYSLVSIEGNFYSVPDKYIDKIVIANVYIEHINIYYNTNYIAHHERIYGNDKYKIDFFHYINTFNRKPGAIENSLALKQAPEVLRKLYFEMFVNRPRDFLYVISKMSLNDILELSADYKLTKRRWFRVNPKYIGYDKPYAIEEISAKQLDSISKVFEQEVNSE